MPVQGGGRKLRILFVPSEAASLPHSPLVQEIADVWVMRIAPPYQLQETVMKVIFGAVAQDGLAEGEGFGPLALVPVRLHLESISEVMLGND